MDVVEEAGGRALLLTADRDLFGAVSERVAVLELRKRGEEGEIGPAVDDAVEIMPPLCRKSRIESGIDLFGRDNRNRMGPQLRI